MTYTIRPAGPEDAAEITALRRMPGVFEQAASLPSDRPRRMEELLRQPGQGRHVLRAVSPDHTVLGLVMLTVESNPRRRHAGGLGIMVRTDCQGQGIAAALCDALEAHCRELGVDAVTVHASKTALPFFLGRGYAIEREQQVPCRGQVLTNYALEKIL